MLIVIECLFLASLLSSPPFTAALRLRWGDWWAGARARGLSPLLLLFFGCVVLGGCANRVRGGWAPLGSDVHEFLNGRMVMAFSTGYFVLVLSGQPVVALLLGFCTLIGSEPGWGCYFGMQRGTNCDDGHASDYKGLRYGMFDWLVGWSSSTWPKVPGNKQAACTICLSGLGKAWAACPTRGLQACDVLGNRGWRRAAAGMWLRGLVWFAPPSFVMQRAGHGHALFLMSAMFPVIYELGNRLQYAAHAPPHWQWLITGYVGYAEFLWGAYIWLVLAAMLLGSDGGHAAAAAQDADLAGASARRQHTAHVLSLQSSGAAGEALGEPLLSEAEKGYAHYDYRGSRYDYRGSHSGGRGGRSCGRAALSWLVLNLSLGPLPEELATSRSRRFCRWVLRLLNGAHLLLNLASLVLLAVVVVENRLGLCADC